MAEAAMIAELLPMVRGDDHHGVVEQPLDSQFLEQPTELFIEEGDAVVVAIAGHLDVPLSGRGILQRHVAQEEGVIPWRFGPDAEAALKSRRGYVRRVGVEVIQEGEKRTIRPPPAEPAQEGFVGSVRTA